MTHIVDSYLLELDLTAKVSNTFGKKCGMICQNGVVLENDEQLMNLKAGDVLDATFALSVNVQPVDPRTGGPVGEPFALDMSNCKLVCLYFSLFFFIFLYFFLIFS